MITGKTDSGFEFEIDEKILDDYELIESLAEVEDGDTLEIVKVTNKVLGDNKEKAFDFIRSQCGYVSTDAVTKLIKDIFMCIGKNGKNS